jgi:hypothetical protein
MLKIDPKLLKKFRYYNYVKGGNNEGKKGEMTFSVYLEELFKTQEEVYNELMRYKQK